MPDLHRRSMLQQALLLCGASLAPGLSLEALAAEAATWKPVLNANEFALLSAVAETIVPGAVEVGVPEIVDALLRTWAEPARRAALMAALDKIDELAKAQHQKAFAQLGLEERKAVLVPHDAAALKTLPKTETPSTATAVGSTQTTMDSHVGRGRRKPGPSMMDTMVPQFIDPAYSKLKELIVVGYYCTEAALTTELRYEHNPGAWEPSLPITPDIRPWGGFALI